MASHIETKESTPVWCQADADVPYEEQVRRLRRIRVALLPKIDQDCTQIVTFCEEWHTQRLYQPFAPTWDAFCTDVLKVEPAWVDRICEGLRLLRAEGHEGPVPAVEAEDRVLRRTAGNPTGHNQYTPKEELLSNNNSSRSIRGTSSGYLTARLKRDKPVIAEALARGEYRSVRAAAKAAGFVHDPTPLTMLHRYWRQVPPEDRIRFLIEMLTPGERKALACGYEE